jgi:hypothetical protein
MTAPMLHSLMKSWLPQRLLYPMRRRFRDRPAVKRKSDVSIVRLVGFFVGGILLAHLVLMTSAMFRGQTAQSQPQQTTAPQKRGPAAAIAAEQTAAPPIIATDGRAKVPATATDARAVAEPAERPGVERVRTAPAERIASHCAEHAREKLMTGLTHYYLQRSLRPRVSTETVSQSAAITTLLAGPADPTMLTPDTACAAG